jgi:hypothetical protein
MELSWLPLSSLTISAAYPPDRQCGMRRHSKAQPARQGQLPVPRREGIGQAQKRQIQRCRRRHCEIPRQLLLLLLLLWGCIDRLKIRRRAQTHTRTHTRITAGCVWKSTRRSSSRLIGPAAAAAAQAAANYPSATTRIVISVVVVVPRENTTCTCSSRGTDDSKLLWYVK